MDILSFIKEHQLNIMLYMSGVCGTLVLLTLFTGELSRRRRQILSLLELSAMFLLICDRYAYIYRGNVSQTGYWMVRICNFMVYFCSLMIPFAVTLYFCDLYKNEGGMKSVPKRLRACKYLFLVGLVLLIVSQFTGLYYTFDSLNRYQRAPGNFICYLVPILMVLLQLSVTLQYRKLLNPKLSFALILNLIVPTAATVIQFFVYGISLTNMTLVFTVIYLYIRALNDLNDSLKRARNSEINAYKEAHKKEHALFEQTTEALTSAIDTKDKYTHGHSSRVAMYSRLIAKEAGMSPEECEKVYFAALLHDVGKIGIPDAIINKDGKLTDEEYELVKKHAEFGDQILSSIREMPYLSLGAHYHHERYDGKGYPVGLVGDDIPEIARIIAVADSYDTMTSKRSYRDISPQHMAREELVKCMGTQFDPKYAKIMIRLVDHDLKYHMHEKLESLDKPFETKLNCESIYHDCSAGILITDSITRIRLFCRSCDGASSHDALPSLILFDSLDGRVHASESLQKELLYYEYGQIRFDGRCVCPGSRKTETKTIERNAPSCEEDHEASDLNRSTRYDVEAVRIGDHVQIRVTDPEKTVQTIVALPDNGRFSYLSITGEHCFISGINIEQNDEHVDEGYITRIAEEISYIKDCPQGDIPNIQIDGWRAKTTQSIPLSGKIRLSFHGQSLPTARLVWHCPFICIFTSKDGAVNGEDFREFVLIRLDGENWESDSFAQNNVFVNRTRDFEGWKVWKEKNRLGIDSEVTIERKDNVVTVSTENLGIVIKSVTTILDKVTDVYAALTGDQCTITNIRVRHLE